MSVPALEALRRAFQSDIPIEELSGRREKVLQAIGGGRTTLFLANQSCEHREKEGELMSA